MQNRYVDCVGRIYFSAFGVAVGRVTVTPQELQIKLRHTGIEKLALEFGAAEASQAMEAAA